MSFLIPPELLEMVNKLNRYKKSTKQAVKEYETAINSITTILKLVHGLTEKDIQKMQEIK